MEDIFDVGSNNWLSNLDPKKESVENLFEHGTLLTSVYKLVHCYIKLQFCITILYYIYVYIIYIYIYIYVLIYYIYK